MSSLIAVATSLLISIGVWGSLLKGAAYLYRRTVVSWSHAFQFAALVFVVVVISRVALSGARIPVLIDAVLGLAIFGTLGAWFFRFRAKDECGVPLGWNRSFRLVTVFFLLCCALAGVALVVLRLLKPAA